MLQIITLLGLSLLMFLMFLSFKGNNIQDDPLSDYISKKDKRPITK
jgi:hypothetical protein